MEQVIRILFHGSINICHSDLSEVTPVVLMINILQRMILQYTSTLEVVRGRGGSGCPGAGVKGAPRGRRRGAGADGLEVVAGQHISGGAAVGAVVASDGAVLAFVLGVGAHQIEELRAAAAREGGGGGGGGGEAEDLLVHELRRVHRAQSAAGQRWGRGGDGLPAWAARGGGRSWGETMAMRWVEESSREMGRRERDDTRRHGE